MKYLTIIIFIIFLSGCVPALYSKANIRESGGTYHKVEKGETLWSISKAYNVSIKDMLEVNRIPDGNKLEAGQLIFIPKNNKEE